METLAFSDSGGDLSHRRDDKLIHHDLRWIYDHHRSMVINWSMVIVYQWW